MILAGGDAVDAYLWWVLPSLPGYTQKPDRRRFKSCPPDQIATVQSQICGFVYEFLRGSLFGRSGCAICWLRLAVVTSAAERFLRAEKKAYIGI